MKNRRILFGLALMGGLCFLNVPTRADDKKAPPKEEAKKDDAKKAEPAKAGTPAHDPGMDAWMSSMTPGPQHALLKSMVGSWQATTKHRMAPDQPWAESKGTSEFKAMMGGRYVQQEVKSPPMMEGMPPFEGFGVTGYDNLMKKYVSTWIDNMQTGVMVSYGTADASGKVITYSSDSLDPMTGKMMKIKSVSRFKDDKTHVFEMYANGEDGKEYMMLEVTYTKK